jgi:hypothetical protein
MDGCLGTLNKKYGFDKSEYSANYLEGWFYDPTLDHTTSITGDDATRPLPFTDAASTGEVLKLSIISPDTQIEDLTTLSGSGPSFGAPLTPATKISTAPFGYTAENNVFNTGLVSGYLQEATDQYSSTGAPWLGYLGVNNASLVRPNLLAGIYTVIIQSGRSEYSTNSVSPVSEGGAVGFLYRNTTYTSEKLINLLGNQQQVGYPQGSRSFYRNEVLTLEIKR